MTPREALYHLVIELGPVPQTNRDDNLSPKEIRLRTAVSVLQECVDAIEAGALPDCDDETVESYRDKLVALYCAEASKH